MTNKQSSGGAAAGAQPRTSQVSASEGSGDRTLGMLNLTFRLCLVLPVAIHFITVLEMITNSNYNRELTIILVPIVIDGSSDSRVAKRCSRYV